MLMVPPPPHPSFLSGVLLVCALLLRLAFSSSLAMAVVGGIKESQGFENNVEVDEAARFAIDEYNKKENALLELVQVVNAREQVVSGTIYYLTLEVKEGGIKRLYEAKVWVKPWMNFRELQEFKPIGYTIQGEAKA